MPKHAGASIAGKNATKCKRYYTRGRRLENKLKRIRQSNGTKAAEYYARAISLGIPRSQFPRTRGSVPLWQIQARNDRS